MRLRLRQTHPKTLREALQSALELEAFQLAEQYRAKPVRGTTLDEGEESTDSRVLVSRKDIQKYVQQCMKSMCHCLLKKKPDDGQGKPSVGQRKGRSKPAAPAQQNQGNEN